MRWLGHVSRSGPGTTIQEWEIGGRLRTQWLTEVLKDSLNLRDRKVWRKICEKM